MKQTLYILFAACMARGAYAAKVHTLPSLPPSTAPHCEVSTNIPLCVNMDRLRIFSLRIAADNIASNELFVAVGCDGNEDGDLSLDEAVFGVSYDCGTRQLVNYVTQEVTTITQDTIAIKRGDFNPNWNLVKIIKRGRGEIGETISTNEETLKFEIKLR